MAAYTFLASEQTIQILSDDLQQPAQRVTARANESGVVYSLLFAPYPTDPTGRVIWTDDAIQQQLSYWAGIWDANAKVTGVADIGVTQNVTAAGRLEDVALVVVSSSSGKSTAQVSLHPREWLPDIFPANIALWVQHLDAVEAGGG